MRVLKIKFENWNFEKLFEIKFENWNFEELFENWSCLKKNIWKLEFKKIIWKWKFWKSAFWRMIENEIS